MLRSLHAVHRVVMIQAPLAVQSEAATQGAPLVISLSIHHPPDARVDQCHGAHCARLTDQVAVVAGAQVGLRARRVSLSGYCLGVVMGYPI